MPSSSNRFMYTSSAEFLVNILLILTLKLKLTHFLFLPVPSEVQLIKREYFNRWYGLKPYYAALVFSRTPATIFFCLVYTSITYPLTAQPMELPRVLMFTSTCIMIALISESMGTVISSTLSVVVSNLLVSSSYTLLLLVQSQ